MKRGDVSKIWGAFLFLIAALTGCMPAVGDTALSELPTAPPPPTALPVLAVVPPPISHTVEGARQDCMLCHAVGAVEAPPVPADAHHEQAVELCRTCHALLPQPALPAIVPPNIPFDVASRDDCLTCHKLGVGYAPRIPENHSGLPVEICRTCHASAMGPPLPEETEAAELVSSQIPHPLEGREDCRLCHETGVGGAAQFPADHVDRANEFCQVCHAAVPQPEAAPVSPTEEATTTIPTEVVSVTGDAAKGATLYATHCAACHGDQGQGTAIAKEPLNSPEFLKSRSDDDLRQATADGIPDTAMPAYSDKLSTVDIADIIAFFRSWR